VSAATRELRDDGVLVDLPARAFDCLVYLIEHRDRAVGRDELIAAVWGRADVSEALLNHTILKIRRVLGSRDNMQTIRTVPRFGYRWVGEIDTESAAASGIPDAPHASAPDDTVLAAPRRVPWWPIALVAAAVLVAVVTVSLVERSRAPKPAVAAKPEDATVAEPAVPALVLPAQIDAPDDWSWLRFGLMDLVANRLRAGAVRTAPSESVVGMLKQRVTADAEALLRDPALAKIATLRVLPRVKLDQDRWIVRLDAFGTQRELKVEAEAKDPIAAARDAADRLVLKLGHTPGTAGATDVSPALDDLMQRAGAAMLADQLDQARDLIERAPPELRSAAPLEQRLAQIELRAGDYEGAERRITVLLDRLDPKRDSAIRARALITLATTYVRRNQFDKADEAYVEAIALRGDAQDPEVRGIAYLGRGIVLAQRNRFDEASAELGRARIELETAGDPLGVATVDVNLGDLQVMRHRPADALPMLKKAAQRYEELGAREGRLYALIAVAGVERELLDPPAALATTDRFWPPEANTSNARMQWTAVRVRADALAANGRLREADLLVERIRKESDPKRDAVARAENEATAAEVAMLRGDAATAAQAATAALSPALRDGDKGLYARTLLLAMRAWRRGGAAAEANAARQQLNEFAASAGDDEVALYVVLADAEQAWADNRRDAALQGYAAGLKRADGLSVPEDLVAIAAPYIDALIEVGHIDDARSVGGRIAPWADRDVRAAWAQVRLFRALGRADAEEKARTTAVKLAGEGALPRL